MRAGADRRRRAGEEVTDLDDITEGIRDRGMFLEVCIALTFGVLIGGLGVLAIVSRYLPQGWLFP